MDDKPTTVKKGCSVRNLPVDKNTEKDREIASVLIGFSVSGSEEPGHLSLGEHLTGDCHMRILMALRRIMNFVDAYSRKL